MTLPLDHIVIAVHDLQSAIHDYRNLGFTVAPGGEHPGRSTHNALVIFRDGTYFELIAWKGPDEANPWWHKLQHFGSGIVDFALLPSSTPQVVAHALSRGLAYKPPADGGRLRPDGVELRWQNARPATPDLPFLCGDLTPRVLRVPDGHAREHANGVQGVAQLRIAVHDLTASLERYRALLGLPDTPLPSEGAASLQLGTTVLTLETADSSSAAADRLTRQGEGPFAVDLYTTQANALGPIAPDNTHGAHLTLVTYHAPLRAAHTPSVLA